MKRFFIKLSIFILVIGVFGGLNYHLYKNGWWEKTLSTTPLPFQLLRDNKNQEVKKVAAKNDGNRSVQSIKNDLTFLSETFSEDKTSRPEIDTGKFDSSSVETLSKMMDPIYGTEYTYIGSAKFSGFIMDKDGWNPLVTFSVFNDTTTIKNITYKFVKHDNQWEIREKISETHDSFAYAEIDSDFALSYLDQIISQDEQFYKNRSWENTTFTSIPDDVSTIIKGNYPNTIERVTYLESTATVKLIRVFGTKSGLVRVLREQTLDNANSPIYTLSLVK